MALLHVLAISTWKAQRCNKDRLAYCTATLRLPIPDFKSWKIESWALYIASNNGGQFRLPDQAAVIRRHRTIHKELYRF